MGKDSVTEKTIGPPSRSRADFFLPPRPARNLDAAEIRITGSSGANASGARGFRVRQVIKSLYGD